MAIQHGSAPNRDGRGNIELAENEESRACDLRDRNRLYAATGCKSSNGPTLIPARDSAQVEWRELRKMDRYAPRMAALGGAQQ